MAASLREALESAVETEEAKPENIPAPEIGRASCRERVCTTV